MMEDAGVNSRDHHKVRYTRGSLILGQILGLAMTISAPLTRKPPP